MDEVSGEGRLREQFLHLRSQISTCLGRAKRSLPLFRLRWLFSHHLLTRLPVLLWEEAV